MKAYPFIAILIFLQFNCRNSEGILSETDGFFFEKISELPNILNESSGLEISADGKIWSMNDKGGQPEIYGFDQSGNLSHTIKITSATNNDWEDLAADNEGNLYIGDFGNNDNDRKNLSILKIKLPAPLSESEEVPGGKIEFSFPDQTEFPPPKGERNFDTEAMFIKENTIYILTKDRSEPFMGKTKLYQIPVAPGTHEAILVNEYFTDTKKKKGQVTAADVSPDGNTTALLTNNMVYIFKNYGDVHFLNGELERNEFPVDRQMEGIVFLDNCNLLLSNEKKSGEPAMLYRVKICP